ncbi:uncharacterized protein C8Q71DRAFT_413673 [Rhodofomes roseus]|uniref:Uncharacterized protein n=1 Tax=Rhodofomes roseus TaxID=34475 RepID=A0A4Y9Y6A1_9APHY|nr:uncharacterized protein C8Q71DRAFT_413673 [Rhodofomes roseus]KAH9840569.1 hypothetical protein C8Q71DRAFT_413673 [Rhodofomes roseus]TFY58026.1 hypothetical protein EVJ58_g6667 [Rhodofomes roseus]
MKFASLRTFAIAGFATLQTVSAVQWIQYTDANCIGSLIDVGSNTGGDATCIQQTGDSIYFEASRGGVECTMNVYNDLACSQFAYTIGDGCQDFGGFRKSVLVTC